MDSIREALPSLPTLNGLPQPFSSLSQLLAAEEQDSKRVRVSKTNWWVDCIRIRGSAILRIWRAVVVITLWATFVAVADLVYGRPLKLSNQVTPLLSVVVGLMLVFRNGTAYQRWDEGRKAFSSLSSTVRSLARSTWINVGAQGFQKTTAEHTSTTTTDNALRKDKIKALRLMVAFVVATKHHVRGEYGLEHEDLAPLLPRQFKHIGRNAGFGWGAAEADAAMTPPPTSPGESVGQEIRRLASQSSIKVQDFARRSGDDGFLQPPKSPRATASGNERAPLLGRNGHGQIDASHFSTDSTVILADYMAKPSLPLPLVIAHELAMFFATAKKRGALESLGPAGYNAFQASVNTCIDQFTVLERLGSIDIPTVYVIHLKQCVSLFLLTLPLVLVESLGFLLVPFTTLIAFTLMGIESIASELEQPCGVDASDLPLDLIAAELRNEVEHMIARLPQGSDDWSM